MAAEENKLIKLLNAKFDEIGNKFDEIGKQLANNGDAMIRMEKEMSGKISNNTQEIKAVKKVAEDTASRVDTATDDIKELKKENMALKNDMQRMADEMKQQGSSLKTFSLSHLDSQRRRYRK